MSDVKLERGFVVKAVEDSPIPDKYAQLPRMTYKEWAHFRNCSDEMLRAVRLAMLGLEAKPG